MARKHRQQMSQINVVPYIDVMLVLLIIFMITAPLLQLGVEIDLPEADAAPMEQGDDPVVVNVMANGDFILSLDGQTELIDEQSLIQQLQVMVSQNPQIQVLIGGDQEVNYGRVYEAMVAVQQAGVSKIGLMSDPLETGGG